MGINKQLTPCPWLWTSVLFAWVHCPSGYVSVLSKPPPPPPPPPSPTQNTISGISAVKLLFWFCWGRGLLSLSLRSWCVQCLFTSGCLHQTPPTQNVASSNNISLVRYFPSLNGEKCHIQSLPARTDALSFPRCLTVWNMCLERQLPLLFMIYTQTCLLEAWFNMSIHKTRNME